MTIGVAPSRDRSSVGRRRSSAAPRPGGGWVRDFLQTVRRVEAKRATCFDRAAQDMEGAVLDVAGIDMADAAHGRHDLVERRRRRQGRSARSAEADRQEDQQEQPCRSGSCYAQKSKKLNQLYGA